MSWVLRDLLWDRLAGCLEYVFAGGGAGSTWDPLSTGTLSNSNRTALGGQNGIQHDFLSGSVAAPFTQVGWVAEITIDAVAANVAVGIWNITAITNPANASAYSNCFWKPNGDYCVNFGQQASAASAWTYGTGDKLGIMVTGASINVSAANVWFFKNGVLLDHGVIQYYAGPPWRIWMRGASGVGTINADLPSMSFKAAYIAAFAAVVGWL